MKLDEQQYTDIVDKLASEIVESAVLEKEAEYQQQVKEIAKEASKKGIVGAVTQGTKAVQKTIKKKGTRGALVAALLGAGAGAGAGYAVGKKAEEEDGEDLEKIAEYEAATIEKAAEVLEQALALEEAANNKLGEAQLYKAAAFKIFDELGVDLEKLAEIIDNEEDAEDIEDIENGEQEE